MRRIVGAMALLTVCQTGSGHAQISDKLHLDGDFRLRYEYTTDGTGIPAAGKVVVRMRAGLTYPVKDYLVVHGRVATGSPDDPNSTDITLGNFVNDLDLALDLASIELTRPHWGLFGGKFTNPFLSTELLWDGDVNPQGAGARVVLGHDGLTTTLTTLYFVVDQQGGGLGSDMGGAQLALRAAPGVWHMTAAAAYYDYGLGTLVNAGAGDIRSNRLLPDESAYLSDFDLLDAIVTVEHPGFGERWPLRLVGDYARNFGAAGGAQIGWEGDVYVGRVKEPGDLRWRYGYALAERDAVLAAFSHDNTTLATNSETHTLALEGVPIADMLLNATVYIYRPHEVEAGVSRGYQTRLRLNATVTF